MFRKSFFQVLVIAAIVLACSNAAFAVVWEGRITAGNDDWEQLVGGGMRDAGSSDLELPYEDTGKGDKQISGVRFLDVRVPKGANITSAYLEFVCDETKDGSLAVSLLIEGQLSPNAPAITGSTDYPALPKASATAVWDVENWTSTGQVSQSSDIAAIIEELVGQDGWVSGNAILLTISDNPAKSSQGIRCAESYNGSSAQASLLHIEFSSKYASEPDPADGAKYEDTWTSLNWTAGETAVTHDVYVSDNFDDVNDGAAAAFQGNQALPFITVGFPGFAYPDGLVPGTTYYWRVDEVEADGTTKYTGPVWSIWIPSTKAYDPSPFDGRRFADADLTLSWTPGFGAKLHTVYFGDNFDDVSNATVGAPATTTTFAPGALDMDKTYYWRVDEFNPPVTVRGDVWSFTTTLPGLGTAVMERWENLNGDGIDVLRDSAKFPNNPDVTETVDKFEWNGADLDDYGARIEAWVYVPATGDYTFWLNSDNQGELWLSTDDDPSNVVLIAQESNYSGLNAWNTGEQQSAPIPLIGGEKYYVVALWKEGGGGDHCQVAWQGPGIPTLTIIPGSNLSPFEPVSAFGAKPANFAIGVSQTPVLQWKPGLEAASHEVYFGTDADAVANATKASPEYKGGKALGDENYESVLLAWETTYYWRVDEINTDNADSPWVGNVWNFTTADFGVVDDFESYNDIETGQPGSNLVYVAWADGFDNPSANGSTMGYFTGESLETGNVHGGDKSVPFAYNNTVAAFSEVARTLAPQNWADNGIQMLSLWFSGDPANVPGQLYVKINGTKVRYDGPAGNLAIPGWQAWNIDLASSGLNLQSVTSLAIGVEGVGATGTLLLDDIGLYRSAPAPVSEWRIAAGSDDGEEHVFAGDMAALDSSDLELGYEGDMAPDSLQTIGCRWAGVPIPRGATITEAWVQFSADDIDNPYHAPDVSVVIEGELSANPATFSLTVSDISGRPTTTAQVVWDVPQWMTVHAKGPEERTPDISSIIQEIVNQ
ncbi:MAG: hypothetical protein U9Q07_04680, partial [Planctomycetota bacterium]|nr:hypothetical protein [Planctomycetota bacterium]